MEWILYFFENWKPMYYIIPLKISILWKRGIYHINVNCSFASTGKHYNCSTRAQVCSYILYLLYQHLCNASVFALKLPHPHCIIIMHCIKPYANTISISYLKMSKVIFNIWLISPHRKHIHEHSIAVMGLSYTIKGLKGHATSNFILV